MFIKVTINIKSPPKKNYHDLLETSKNLLKNNQAPFMFMEFFYDKYNKFANKNFIKFFNFIKIK